MRKKGEVNKVWWSHFHDLLDRQTEWPNEYTFKFIVPRAGLEELQEVFGDHPVTVRASSRGRYVSVTAHMQMHSAEEVINIYHAAGEVEGVISL